MKTVKRAYYAIFLRDDLPRLLEALYIKAPRDINMVLEHCRLYDQFQVAHLIVEERETMTSFEKLHHLHDWKKYARTIFRVENERSGVYTVLSGTSHIPFLKELTHDFADFSTIPQLAVGAGGHPLNIHEEEK